MVREVRIILNAAAKASGLAVSDILSISRSRSCVATRAAVAYLARERTGASYPELGRMLRRHHTTVLNAHRVFSLWLEAQDARAWDLLQRIEREIDGAEDASSDALGNSSR